MKQDTNQFQGVLKRLEAWKRPQVESCERRATRYSVRCEARLFCEASGNSPDAAEQLVQIRDLSRTGAGLLSAVPIEAGTRWRLQPTNSDLVLADMPVFCRFCRRIEDNVYLVGMEFGIEAATMIALGVNPADLHRDETIGSALALSDCQFIDPSELNHENAA